MYTPDEVHIEASHFELLAEHGKQVALVATINHDVNAISGLLSFHEYEGTFVVEMAYQTAQSGRMDSYYELLNYYGDDSDVVRKMLDNIIDEQEHSDDEPCFSWELISGTESVQTDSDLAETLNRVVRPERLEPEFDIPEDAPVAILDVGYEGHDIIKQANEYHVGVPVDIRRHRGHTYLVGLTEEYATAISKAIHRLQMEYSQNGAYDSAEVAERVEGAVYNAETATGESVH